MMLKAFGLSDEDVERIRVFIPQVPTVAQNVVTGVNTAIKDFDTRLRALESFLADIYERQGLVETRLEELHASIRSWQLRQTDLQRTDNHRTGSSGDSAGTGGNGGRTGGDSGTGIVHPIRRERGRK
jgi:hypothetical protein